MSSWVSFSIPVLLGVLAVLQAGLNRRIADVWGLSGATLLNSLMFFLVALVLYFGDVMTNPKASIHDFKFWFAIPGVLGLAIVVGLPLSMSKWGAMNTFLWLIASQIVASAFWDFLVEGEPFSWKKLIGGGVAIAGAWIAVR